MTGFWKAPRALARMLATRELTASEYALLNFVCQSGADRPGGFVTTNGLLASVLDVSEKTVRRGLRALRARDFLAFDDHERVAAFTVRSADTLRSLEGVSMSAAMSAGSADTPVTATARKAASEAGNPADTPADTSRARAKTETETENDTYGVARPLRTSPSENEGAQALVARYIDAYADATGLPAPTRVVGQVAGQVGQLLREQQPPDVIERALQIMLDRRLNPSTLPSLMNEAAAGPPERGHVNSTADLIAERVAHAQHRDKGEDDDT